MEAAATADWACESPVPGADWTVMDAFVTSLLDPLQVAVA